MSKSLEGQVPDLENQIENLMHDIPLALIKFSLKDNSTLEIEGSVAALSIGDDSKIEIKTKLSDAIFILQQKSNIIDSCFYVTHRDILISQSELQDLLTSKVSNIDLDKQSCILTLDLKRRS